jgi:ketosteroid isomerase-like protein
MPPDNVDLIRQLLDAFNRGDGAAVRQFWTTDGEWRPAYAGGGLLEGKVYRGREEVIEFVTVQAETWESIVATPIDMRSVGDRVLVEVHLQAVGRASGLAVDETTWNVFEVRDGSVAAGRVYTAKEEALEALGLWE